MKDILRTRLGILSIMTAGLAIFGLLIWLLFGGNPPTNIPQNAPVKLPEISLPIKGDGVTFADVSIPGDIAEIPPEMPIYLESSRAESSRSAALLGNKLGLGIGIYNSSAEVYTWSGSGQYISYDPKGASLVYARTPGKLGNFREDKSTEIVSRAKDFLSSLGAGNNLATGKVSWMRSYGGESDLVDNFNQANMAVVTFVVSLNGYGIYNQTGLEINQNVWIGSDMEVYKASLVINEWANSQKTAIIRPISQIVAGLVNGEGIVVSSASGERSGNFARLVVDRLSVGYLIDPNSRIVQPIYVVKGKGYRESTADGTEMVIYLQAVKND